MRLDRIQARAFLSHADTDLHLNGERLIALTGANGAGKSSLVVDAPLFALFDDARGRTDDLVQTGSTEMSVLVEFELAGARYRVTRLRSTRSGGRSSLELAIADGDAWRPLTGESIRETEQRIRELLRMDAATFETAVVLVQGEAMRFADATAGERKRILGQVLGLDVYERAEAAARDRARTVDARMAGARQELDRLEQRIDDLADAPEQLETFRAEAARIEADIAAAAVGLADAEQQLRALAVDAAAARAAITDVERIADELRALKVRWERAEERRQEAAAARAAAQRTIDAAADIEAAAAALPGMRERLDAMEALEATVRSREQELRGWEDRRVRAEREDQRRLGEWRQRRAQLESAVATLEASVGRLAPVECPGCRRRFPADPAGLEAQLKAARTALAGHEGEPAIGTELLRASAQADRVRDKIRELAFDPEALSALRRQVADAGVAAARLAGLEAARAAIAAADREAQRAAAEQAEVTEAAGPAKEAMAAARARAAEAASIERRTGELERELTDRRLALVGMERGRADRAAAIGRSEARVADLERATADREARRAAMAEDDRHLLHLRRLVEAFGVKGIPARIIASVLPEIEGHANELLGELRPGMSLAVRAQRARKGDGGTVEALDLAVQDAAGERPLALFSGGERMSVSLAIAVALSRLVARRSGAAIRSLVIDEPDGLDADARRAFGQALRVLAHRGELERTVLVSHHPDLAEVADEVYRVTKVDGRSVVEVAG